MDKAFLSRFGNWDFGFAVTGQGLTDRIEMGSLVI
jgi:hypothetical protein